MNEPERPRILVAVERERVSRFAFLVDREGTHRFITKFGEVDLSEWDVLITDRQLVNATLSERKLGWWSRQVPLGLQVFFVLDPEMPRSQSSVIDIVTSATDDTKAIFRFQERVAVPGNRAMRVDGLPDSIQSLVRKDLVPVVTGRQLQFGLTTAVESTGIGGTDARFRPFLVGPQEVVLAGSHRRGPFTDVWMVPADLPDFEPWFDLALEEWHEADPSRFPGAPRWVDATDWMTSRERDLLAQRAAEEERFEPLAAEHAQRMSDLEQKSREAREEALAGRLRLLTSQGDELQASVLDALTSLGFDVENMDDVWQERERREDFRIRDARHPEWIAIADATGVAKGVKGAKLQLLASYVLKFMVEEKPESQPTQWLIVNQWMGRDPNTRGDLLRGDELRALVGSGGLALDTAALFELVRAVDENPDRKAEVRDFLRISTGQVRLQDARDWLSE